MPIGDLGASINRFAFDLQRALPAEGNLIWSPASVWTALGMLDAGARGSSARALEGALGLKSSGLEEHARIGALVASWNSASDATWELRVANRLWLERSFQVVPDFQRTLREAYGAEAERMDFRGAPEPSREGINQWVADQTLGRITDLLPSGSVHSDTSVVLTDAIAFTGFWSEPFDPKYTRPAPFAVPGAGPVQVPMMTAQRELAWVASDGARVVTLPYAGGELAMMVVLPDDPEGLSALEARLDAGAPARWASASRERLVAIQLPRFALATTEELRGPLTGLGLGPLFDDRADLSGISAAPLVVDGVYHQAQIEVDEEGTVAVAATAITIRAISARVPERFVVDRPFLAMIVHQPTGTVLFLARVTDPR